MFKNLFSKGQDKVQSFSDKLRAFPEYHQVDSSLESCLKEIVKKQSHFDQAQGNCYNEFARKQTNESISDILGHISDNLKALEEEAKKATETLPKIRTDLVKLRTLNDDIRAKRKDAHSKQDRAKKSASQAEKAEKKVETLRLKNPSSPEFSKAQDEYDRAVKQKQADATASEERDALLVTESKEYKKQLFQTILTALSQFATAQKEAADGMAPIGDKIKELAITIPTYTDPSIEVLQTKVQTLRSEPVE